MAPGSRKKGRRRKPLSNNDKLMIVYKALTKGELRKDVAKEMRVSSSVVSKLVTAFKEQSLMDRLQFEEENYDMKVNVVKKIVNEMLEDDEIIDSAQSVSWRVEDEVGVTIRPHFVRAVMTKELGMSYRKILKASYHSNST